MLARGVLYWLRAPRNDADIRHDEWILAFARLFLSACCLAVIIHARVAGSVQLPEVLSFSYCVYSLLVILSLRVRSHPHPLFYIGIHCADMLWAVSLIILIHWPAMAFALFLFVLAGTIFRWGFWEVELACFSLFLLLFTGCRFYHVSFFQLLHYQNIFEFLPEAMLYTAIAFIAGLLAEARAMRVESYAISKTIERIRLQPGLEPAIRTLCTEGLQLFGATQILMVIQEKNAGAFSLFRMASSHPALETHELNSSQQLQYFFPAPATSWRMASTRHSGHPRFEYLMFEGGKLKRDGINCAMPDSFLTAHPFHTLLASSINIGEEWVARVFVIDPMLHFGGAAGLRFLDRSVHWAAPVLQDIFLAGYLEIKAKAAISGQVARELHDGVIQTLCGINLQLEELRRKAGPLFTQGEDPLARIQQSIQEELASLREFTQQLRSLEVDSGNLFGFLTGLAVKFQCEHGIHAQFVSEVDEVRLRPSVCAELARIVQEALINVRKHSGAKEVVVRFSRRNGKAVLDIIDNGKGFGFSGRRSHEELQASGKGPIVIMERARAIHGEVSVESVQGGGSWMQIAFPYEVNCGLLRRAIL